jgi:drug/metabolite transporter (DMT)-like permease
MPDSRKPLDGIAIGTMLLLCMIWGFNQVTVKVAAAGISPIMQAGIRSLVATALIMAYARCKGIALFGRDGTLAAGVLAGVLFGMEFALMFDAIKHTTISRLVVLVYTAPCLTAIGLSWFVAGERLRPRQWAGIALAFAGIVVAFGEKFGAPGHSWRGDVQALAAAALWAATTVAIRITALNQAAPAKTLFYQLTVSAVLLPVVALLMGESGVTALTPLIAVAMLFQCVVVAFASYLAWFWLLSHYLASRLSVFSFLTPLFGVGFGAWFFNDPLTSGLLGATALVAAGIALVNWR